MARPKSRRPKIRTKARDPNIQAAVIRHAARDLEATGQPGRITEKRSIAGKFADLQANQPSLMGQLAAIGREAIKDIRNTVNQFFFNQGEQSGEPGTPLNPTQQIVTQEQGNFHGYDPSEYARPDPTPTKDRSRGR